MNNGSLKALFPILYELSLQKDSSVQHMMMDRLNWRFRREIVGDQIGEYNKLQEMCGERMINFDKDRRVWRWNKEGVFTVKTGYQFLIDRGMRWGDTTMWRVGVPLKLKIHMWLCMKGKLNTKKKLVYKGMVVDTKCILCDKEEEDIDHIFFKCDYVQKIWDEVRSSFGLRGRPQYMEGLWTDWLNPFKEKGGCVEWEIYLMTICWCIWGERNRRLFEETCRNNACLLECINAHVFYWIGHLSGVAGKRFKKCVKHRGWAGQKLCATGGRQEEQQRNTSVPASIADRISTGWRARGARDMAREQIRVQTEEEEARRREDIIRRRMEEAARDEEMTGGNEDLRNAIDAIPLRSWDTNGVETIYIQE